LKKATVGVAAALALFALPPLGAQTQGGKSGASAPPIARVGDQTIPRSEYQQRFSDMEQEYRQRAGTAMPAELRDFVRRQALETLIRERLLVLEASRRGIGVTDVEAEERMKQEPFFNPGGIFDPSKFEAFKLGDPESYRQALAQIKRLLAAQKLQQQVLRESAPRSADVRARAERRLARATAEVFALSKGDFSGAFPEPLEAEVLAEYQRTKASLRSPDRATISVILINQPALSGDDSRDAKKQGAWEQRMQARADSVLRRLREGEPFDSVGVRADGFRSRMTLTRGETPEFWGENPGWEDAVFRARPGALLTRVWKARPGRLLVRVDDVAPGGVPPLREASRDIRNRLRFAARAQHEARSLRAFYEAGRESLATLGVRVRYVAADTGAWPVKEPSASEVDRYYRSRLADYATYDATKGEIVTRPLTEVRGEIVARWKAEQRYDQARAAAERVFVAWDRGARDAAAERAMGGVMERGPVPLGIPVDSTRVGAVLGDSLANQGGKLGTGFVPWDRGFLVYRVYENVPGYVPTFEQSQAVLRERKQVVRDREDEAAARAYFESHRDEFRSGQRRRFRYVGIQPLEPPNVPLTRAEVEGFFAAHRWDYGVPPEVRVRHILIAPAGKSVEADRAARERASALLRRARAGEDFAELARQFSDDPASKNDGGDLGFFGPGVMVPEFEKVAFDLVPGEVSDLVKTEFGYHVVRCIEHKEGEQLQLAQIYSTVGYDAARAKADSLIRRTADSLRRAVRSPNALVEFSQRRGGTRIGGGTRDVSRPMSPHRELRRIEEAVEKASVGQILPAVFQPPATNMWAVYWVDSIEAPRRLEWAEARDRALQSYRAGAGERALTAKRAELDSMAAQGWTVDSLAALWGGLERLEQVGPGTVVAGMGSAHATDSLIFGGGGKPGVAAQQWSGWLEGSGAWVRLRVVDRQAPSASELAQRVEREERLQLERNLYQYFENLKKRYPVRIVDAELGRIELPPPEPDQG
jgi:parvulin-like peptidyl-prolyl isomerase